MNETVSMESDVTGATNEADIYYVTPESDSDREVVEAASAASAAHLRHRSDIVKTKGRYTVTNTGSTPHEAMIEDLLFIRNVLDEAGIEYLLVRGNDERPVIAVDWTSRRQLRQALIAACAREPFYSKTVDAKKGGTVLIADGALSATSHTRIFRLYRPRLVPDSGLLYGASAGVQIELWAMESDTIVLPMENSLTRQTLPADEAIRGSVERYGKTWPTIENMFADHASDIHFEIDIVFSWVDGNSPEFQRKRAARMKNTLVGEGDDAVARFRQIDELKYALRSVHIFAPWIRHIFIATDSDRPEWLAEHPKVTLVRSEEFFADPSVLPTHNSQAIESQLQHIPGLSEHFLYSNDDMFFGRLVGPDMFFSPGGVTKFIEARTRIGLGENNLVRSGFENSARVNRKLLQQRFGRVITRHLEHTAAPLRKSVLREMEQEFSDEFAATAASTFRASDNISVTNSLYHFYAMLTGRAVTQQSARVKYIDTTTRAGLKSLDKLLTRRSTDMFCLNDGSFPEVGDEERERLVTGFLQRYFPLKAPWER